MSTYRYDKFTLTVDEPVVVMQGGTWEESGWGPYQFPKLSRTRNGHIFCSYSGPKAVDEINGYEEQQDGGNAGPVGKVSEDDGTTWRQVRPDEGVVSLNMGNGNRLCMGNGKEYIPPKAKNAYAAPWLDQYEPTFKRTSVGRTVDYYPAEQIPEFNRNPEAYEYDPATGKTEAFRMTVNWPHMTMCVYHMPDGSRLIYPLEMIMGGMGRIMAGPDETMFLCTYMDGFSAETGEPTIYHITVLRSDDYGRTWDYQSEVLTPASIDPSLPGFDGFCEPFMARVPDGSVVMLIRCGSGFPSHIVRSTDNCKTWSEPAVFDKCGVLPQLLSLECGVTLASYGRLGVYLRATADESAMVWETPVDLGVPLSGDGSCCYTSLLALDDHTALVVYSHFKYPNADGVPVKTILTRKIHIARE